MFFWGKRPNLKNVTWVVPNVSTLVLGLAGSLQRSRPRSHVMFWLLGTGPQEVQCETQNYMLSYDVLFTLFLNSYIIIQWNQEWETTVMRDCPLIRDLFCCSGTIFPRIFLYNCTSNERPCVIEDHFLWSPWGGRSSLVLLVLFSTWPSNDYSTTFYFLETALNSSHTCG